MSRRDDGPGGWRSESETPRDPGERPTEETESWFENLSARPRVAATENPGSQRSSGDESPDRGSLLGPNRQTETRAGDAASVASAPVVMEGSRHRAASRTKVRRKISYVDPLSVLKLSLLIYALLLAGWLLFVAIFYNFLDSLGLFDNINSALRGFAYDEVDITLGVVERWALIAGVVLTIGGAVFNVFVSLVYNLLARFLGGLEVTVSDSD